MSRPPKCRRVCFVPGARYFKPAGIPVKLLEQNCLSVEEMESVRLRDLEGLDQAECARRMNISRPTFQRVLATARTKIADSLASGKALRIEGGNYEFAGASLRCGSGHLWSANDARGLPQGICPVCRSQSVESVLEGRVPKVGRPLAERKRGHVKIAVATEDGLTVSQHFGRATQYVVVKDEGGRRLSREVRQKASHKDFAGSDHHDARGHGCGLHGTGTGDRDKHGEMAQSILDCSTLLVGGMGSGAYLGLKARGIEPVITDVHDIEEAVRLFLDGKLPNLTDKLH